MAFPVLGLHSKTLATKVPFLMDQADSNLSDNELVIDITSSSGSCSSSSSHESLSRILDQQDSENQPSTSLSVPVYPPHPFPVSSSRSSTISRRRNRRARRRSPLNSVLWICVELVLTLSKIIVAVLVLLFSQHEKANAPLRTWIVGYAFGCLGILPLLYWRYKHRNLGFEESPSQTSDSAVPLTGHSVDEEDQWSTSASALGIQSNGFPNSRLKVCFGYLKIALDCFFAIWFVVGNVWVFGGHSSSTEAPNLYRLCIVFLTFSCIGYAMPFILCATICCCMPCIISVLGIREDLSQGRGATEDSINSLPTYNFTAMKNMSENECGIVCAGTDKEHTNSEEDAVCCICLTRYVNDDKLRELPCSHFFHKECVDKWLKINASCPLCKADVGETLFDSLAEATASLRNDTIV